MVPMDNLRGLITIHLGQAGVQIGTSCWQLFAMEHGILPDGYYAEDHQDKKDFYSNNCLFEEFRQDRMKPRTVFVDLNPNEIDEICNKKFRGLFHINQFVTGLDGAGGNYGRGYFLKGEELIPEFINKILTVSELCNNFSGFLIFHSVGGGTGSGLTAQIMQELSDRFPKKTVVQFSIIPSARFANTIVEPYNGILGSHCTIEHSGCSFLFDNESVYDICSKNLNFKSPKLIDLNKPISTTISGITSSLRYGGPVNANLDQFQTNLVPYPRTHFILPAYAPFVPENDDTSYKNLTIKRLTENCLDRSNRLINCSPAFGKYIACCFLYRGSILPSDVTEVVNSLKNSDKMNFVDWCPTGINVGINYQPSIQIHDDYINRSVIKNSLCMLSNNTAVVELWARMGYKFDLMFAKRAFVHWYLSEGMEIDDFIEARDDIIALEQEYHNM